MHQYRVSRPLSCTEAVYHVEVHDVTRESRDDIRSAWRVQCSTVRPNCSYLRLIPHMTEWFAWRSDWVTSSSLYFFAYCFNSFMYGQ